MKKLFYLLILGVVLAGWGAVQEGRAQFLDNEIRGDRIYLFYSEGCPHCRDAEAYLAEKHPGLQMERLSVRTRQGYDLFVACVRKFNLGSQVGTPLFCMGDHYLMGWADDYPEKFEAYAKPFLK